MGLNARVVAKYSDFGPIEGHTRKRCKIGGKVVLSNNKKSIFVPKAVTLNDLERRNGPYAYFASFRRIRFRKIIMRPTSVSKSTFDNL